MSDPIPFTLLTGFLGAGKTTVLNRMLRSAEGKRIAILVNELGKIGIDGSLILSQGGDVLELAGGCVCCKIDVKNDLWDGIIDVVKRTKPEHVVLETTGIADPSVILQELPNRTQGVVSGAGVVCVFDAECGARSATKFVEARHQLQAADRILFSKLDVATPAQVAAAHDFVLQQNPRAERSSFSQDTAGDRALLHWLLETRSFHSSESARAPQHRHSQLVAVALENTHDLVRQPFLQFLQELQSVLVRVKGWVTFAGESGAWFVELAGKTWSVTPWSPPDDRQTKTELVMIGEGLDEPQIRRKIDAFRVGPSSAV